MAKYRGWVVKQVSINFHCAGAGSYIDSWRTESFSGTTLADGWSEPALQKAGLFDADAASHRGSDACP